MPTTGGSGGTGGDGYLGARGASGGAGNIGGTINATLLGLTTYTFGGVQPGILALSAGGNGGKGGNGYVSVRRAQPTFLGELNNLHRGVGMSIGWVLFIDTFAGSILLLSLTGVLLWTELNRRRTIGVVLVLGSIVAAVLTGMF